MGKGFYRHPQPKDRHTHTVTHKDIHPVRHTYTHTLAQPLTHSYPYEHSNPNPQIQALTHLISDLWHYRVDQKQRNVFSNLNYSRLVYRNNKILHRSLVEVISYLPTSFFAKLLCWRLKSYPSVRYITYDKFRCEIISVKRCPTENLLHQKFSITWFQWIFGELLKFHRNFNHRKYYHRN